MVYDAVIMDSITCDFYVQVMYEGENSNRTPLLEIQTKSANLVANKKDALLHLTSETKEILENRYSNGDLPIGLSCLLTACKEIGIFSKDENDSIIKACSFLSWKKVNFCVLTGNSLLKDKLEKLKIKVYDLSQSQELLDSLKP